ncbi:hypothetical protein F5B21DRAFT_166556 [Xylaria acuta]|nr:hypothetical protein F5B21DRAFT_166556 [Xylaria acuta]
MTPAVAFPTTKTASNVDHAIGAIAKHDNDTINLRQHSLNAVVGRNKSLWRPPEQWTQTHLQALCVDRRDDADADADVAVGVAVGVDVDALDRDKHGSSFHALIPDLHQDHLQRFITTMTKGVPPRARAVALNAMLVFPRPPPRPMPMLMPMREDVVAVDVGRSPRLDHVDVDVDGEAVPFSHYGDCVMELAVGRRAYRLPLLFSFHLGPLALPYLDSAQIDQPPRRVGRRHLSNQPYEPCIAAVLIAIAQTSGSSTDKSVAMRPPQLIFTHRDDDQDMHVYTARVSQLLLERFRHPNRSPTACARSHATPSLIELQHMRVPYKPNDTFRRRILAAVSVTATTIHKSDYFSSRKRKSSHACNIKGLKRRRQEDPRTPLYNLDPNCYHA